MSTTPARRQALHVMIATLVLQLVLAEAARAQETEALALCDATPTLGFVQMSGPAAAPIDPQGEPWREFTDDAEEIVLGPWPNGQTIDMQGGDDWLWLSPEVSSVTMGLGSDTLILCEMRGLLTVIDVGAVFESGPEDADTVIIAAEVLRDAPPGFYREIQIMGLQRPLDKVVVEVPEGWSSGTRPEQGGISLQFDDVMIRLLVDLNEPFDLDNMELFHIRAEDAQALPITDEDVGGDTAPSLTTHQDASDGMTQGLDRGGVFCAATAHSGFSPAYGKPLCEEPGQVGCLPADPDAAAVLVLGAETGQIRPFGYEVWFGNGHSCALRGNLTRDDAGWVYSDATCALRLDLSDRGAALVSTGAMPCETMCGARAGGLGGLSGRWQDSPVMRPEPTLTARLEEACGPGVVLRDVALTPDASAAPAAPARAQTYADPDAHSLPPEIAVPLRAQRILNTLGYQVYALDGVFGPRSRAALAAFLADQGAPGDGSLTTDAFRLLEDVLAARPIPPRPDEPEAMLRQIYSSPDGQGVFAFTQRAGWFTADTLDLIAWAELRYSQRFGIDGFDFNPVMPGNAWSIQNLQVQTLRSQANDTAETLVQFDSFNQPVTLSYLLRREGGVWRIHDIVSDQGSLRAMMRAME